jgi:hypothetical protein
MYGIVIYLYKVKHYDELKNMKNQKKVDKNVMVMMSPFTTTGKNIDAIYNKKETNEILCYTHTIEHSSPVGLFTEPSNFCNLM